MSSLCKSLKMTLLCLLAVLVLAGSGPPQPQTVQIPEISDRINAFTLDLLKRYADGAEAEGNAILSPQSIFHGLAMSYVASGGKTRKELARVMHFPDDNKTLMTDLAELRRAFEATAKDKATDAVMANAIWLDSTYATYRKDYVAKVEKAFSASLHSIKFGERTKASEEINHWVSEKTRGQITGTVRPDDFTSRSGLGVINEPALVSVNAVYFKADWGSRFEKGATQDRPFHVNSTTTGKAPLMHQNPLLPYAANDDFQFLEIPFIDGHYSMYLLLPRKILGVKELMRRLSAKTVIDLKRSSATYRVNVLLPKFEIARHYGIKDQFRTSARPAPLTGMRTSTP